MKRQQEKRQGKRLAQKKAIDESSNKWKRYLDFLWQKMPKHEQGGI